MYRDGAVGKWPKLFQFEKEIIGLRLEEKKKKKKGKKTNRVGVLSDLAAGNTDDVRRVMFFVHASCLAGVNHEKDLIVTFLLPHLLECIGQLHVGYFFVVLEFQESVASVTFTKVQL
jgi:hypothetical protein